MPTLSEAVTNIETEAHNLGVKVTSEKTFLTFDKENERVDECVSSGLNSFNNGRRFTTTDLVMNKELMERSRSLESWPGDLSEGLCEADAADSTDDSGMKLHDPPVQNDHPCTHEDDLRRFSVCTDRSSEFYSPTKSFSVNPGAGLFNKPPPSILIESPTHSPVAFRPSPSAYPDTSQFTTVMIRNIPNRYSQDDLILMIKALGFTFNFFYCPIDKQSRANCGYFFANMTSPSIAQDFVTMFHGLQLPACKSNKVCSACWARIQGYSANVDHYKHSLLMELPREYRPRIFGPDGKEVTVQGEPCEAVAQPKRPNSSLRDRKVFVGGLAPTTTAGVIEHVLSQFGAVEDVSIIHDSTSRLPRGFAFVTFADAASLKRCVAAKETHFIDGRCVGIRPYTAANQ